MKEKPQEQKAVVNVSPPTQKPPMSAKPLGPSLQFQKKSDDKSGKDLVDLVLSDDTKLTYESKGRFFRGLQKNHGHRRF